MPLQQRKAQIAADASADAKNKARATNLVDKFPKTGSRAGAAAPGDMRSAVRLAKGALARPRRPTRYVSAVPTPKPYDAKTLQTR